MKRKPPKGFSLIELIVYFTIFGIVASVGATVLNFTLEGKIVVQRMSDVHLNTERVMQQMIDRVRVSDSIVGASSTLSLEMASSSINPTIFSVSSGVISIKEGSDSAIAITPDTIYVDSLTFVKIDNPSPSTSTVQIIITAGSNDSGGVREGTAYTLQTTAMPLR